ncbi:MAG TPA: VOC family protein [Polyangiaceae bacterium]|jgi:catechol 2,3-dioxygenase-like lactoylglutathione lyase family enzyme|nr:VOC family protein [Polyangiaceae bacterium]
MSVKMRGLRHVAFRCKDLAAMERFYVELLGYRIEWRPDAENVYLTSGEDSLALHAEPSMSGEETHLDHIGILVDTPQEVDSWAEHLGKRGAELAAMPRTHRDGCRSFYVADPEGNKIQFLYHPALSGLAAAH